MDPRSGALSVGLCDYKSFIATNLCTDASLVAALEAEGSERGDNARLLFADAFGNAALLVTGDGMAVLQLRASTAEFNAFFDFPGGHAEPDKMPSDRAGAAAVARELFQAVLDEVVEELHCSAHALEAPLLLGVIRAKANRGKPTAVFYVQGTFTSRELAACYASGTHGESSALAFVTRDGVVASVVPRTDAVREGDGVQAMRLTPSAEFGLASWRKRDEHV